MDLLLKWGADPTDVSAESVIDTYKTELIDRFWRAGVDYTLDPGFVTYLAQTVNKPLYGWLRRNRSDQRLKDALDVALLEAHRGHGGPGAPAALGRGGSAPEGAVGS